MKALRPLHWPAALVLSLLLPLRPARAASPGEPALPLDADSIAFMQRQPPAATVPTPAQRKEAYRRGRLRNQPDLPQIYQTRDEVVPGPGGDLRLRLYFGADAPGEGPAPALIFYHGGGWMLGDLDSHDWLCRSLANQAKCIVVAVDYRLTPEHVFPAAFDDCLAASRWVAAHAAQLRIDPERMAVGGDSAGGNLAAATALAWRDEALAGAEAVRLPGPQLRAQILIYPAVDLTLSQPPDPRFEQGLILTNGTMRYLIEQYVPRREDRTDWRASPLCARSLAGLPLSLVVEAGCDPLCAQVEEYTRRLEHEGSPVSVLRYPGQMHGFLSNARWLPRAQEAVAAIAQGLQQAWSDGPPAR